MRCTLPIISIAASAPRPRRTNFDGIQPHLEIFQPIGDGVLFAARRRDVEELALGDDRRDLFHWQQQHDVLAPYWNAFQPRQARLRFIGVDRRLDPIDLRRSKIRPLEPIVRARERLAQGEPG